MLGVGGLPAGTAVSTGVRTTQALEPRSNAETGTAAPAAAATSPTISAQQHQDVANAAASIGAQAAGMSDYAITSGIINKLQQTGDFTAAEIQAASNAFINPNTGTFSFAATPGQVQGWVQQIEGPLLTALNAEAIPVVGSDAAPLQPLPPPPSYDGSGGFTTTPAPTTDGGGTTTTSTGGTDGGTAGYISGTAAAVPDFSSMFAQWLASIGGTPGTAAGGQSSGGAGVTGAGDAPGTSTPISSLGALTPIGTPTTTQSAGSPEIVLGVIAAAGAGVGFWLYERHKHKMAKGAPPPARAAA